MDSLYLEESAGSPPHLRGAQARVNYINSVKRITPAPAGSTSSVVRLSYLSQDHPRTCGEHVVSQPQAVGVG